MGPTQLDHADGLATDGSQRQDQGTRQEVLGDLRDVLEQQWGQKSKWSGLGRGEQHSKCGQLF